MRLIVRSRGVLLGSAAFLVFGVACVTVWMPVERVFHRTAAVAGAQPVGASECLTCHEDVQGHAPIAEYHADCESCHGAGGSHAESEDPLLIRFPAAADCLSCHESGRTTHMAWSTSEHQRAGVLCSDCHNPHNRAPLHVREVESGTFRQMDPKSSLCVTCHQDVASRLSLPSHHPVQEGMLACTDCHSPHEDRRIALGTRTTLCEGCHQDHAGPWIYEHLPAIEDCTTCHNPHGTASYNLLDTSQPAICLSCHTLPDDRHFRTTGESGLSTISSDNPVGASSITSLGARAFYTRCTDCHGAIHGSYQDVHLRR